MSAYRLLSGSRWGGRTRTYAAAAALALAASAVCALIAPGKADAAPACRTAANPYSGARVVRVYDAHGIVVRRYTKGGLTPVYVATADAAHAVARPIMLSRVNARSTLRPMILGSRAFVGVNGDFFRNKGDGTSMSVEVVAGRVIKAKAIWQPALITLTNGRLVYGPLRANIALTHGSRRYLASVVNDTTMPRNGVSVFTPSWGAREPMRSTGGWREWVVSHGRVIASHAYATHAVIPRYGYVVEASGTAAARMRAQGWVTGATVGLHTNAISTMGAVHSALGAGSRLVHQGVMDRGGCVNDQPSGRTSVGIYAGGLKVSLVSFSKGRGMSERELASFMRSLGVREAVSLDGGGSSTMASRTRYFTAPRFSTYRAVANGFGFYLK